MGTRHWLSVVGMFVCGVNELTRLEAPWIPVIITSLLSPLALIAASVLFCALFVFMLRIIRDYLRCFLYALLETYQRFSINHVWPVFCSLLSVIYFSLKTCF